MSTRIISVTTDFGVQSQGLGVMEAVAYSIAPDAKYINLMHGLPSYQLAPAARTLETTIFLPVGNHVCVVDPGVGSRRLGVILATKRGDYLIGPDNGVLLPAASMLGGITSCNVLENPEYMLHPISPLFHARDVFIPAAAHAAKGVPPDNFGNRLPTDLLVDAPYGEAIPVNGVIQASVIHINAFGAIIFNISHQTWDSSCPPLGQPVILKRQNKEAIVATHGSTYSDVGEFQPVIMRDDYGRVEVAINRGSIAKAYDIVLGEEFSISMRKTG